MKENVTDTNTSQRIVADPWIVVVCCIQRILSINHPLQEMEKMTPLTWIYVACCAISEKYLDLNLWAAQLSFVSSYVIEEQPTWPKPGLIEDQ